MQIKELTAAQVACSRLVDAATILEKAAQSFDKAGLEVTAEQIRITVRSFETLMHHVIDRLGDM